MLLSSLLLSLLLYTSPISASKRSGYGSVSKRDLPSSGELLALRGLDVATSMAQSNWNSSLVSSLSMSHASASRMSLVEIGLPKFSWGSWCDLSNCSLFFRFLQDVDRLHPTNVHLASIVSFLHLLVVSMGNVILTMDSVDVPLVLEGKIV